MRVVDFFSKVYRFTPPEDAEYSLRYRKFEYVNLWFRRLLLIAETHCQSKLDKKKCERRDRVKKLRDYYDKLYDEVNFHTIEDVIEYFDPNSDICTEEHASAFWRVFRKTEIPEILDFHLGLRFERETAAKGLKILDFERFVRLFHAVHNYYGAITFNKPPENSPLLELAIDGLLLQLLFKISSHNLTFDNITQSRDRLRKSKERYKEEVIEKKADLVKIEFNQIAEKTPNVIYRSDTHLAERIQDQLKNKNIKISLPTVLKYAKPLRKTYMEANPKEVRQNRP
jgi:hypothetical protein